VSACQEDCRPLLRRLRLVNHFRFLRITLFLWGNYNLGLVLSFLRRLSSLNTACRGSIWRHFSLDHRLRNIIADIIVVRFSGPRSSILNPRKYSRNIRLFHVQNTPRFISRTRVTLNTWIRLALNSPLNCFLVGCIILCKLTCDCCVQAQNPFFVIPPSLFCRVIVNSISQSFLNIGYSFFSIVTFSIIWWLT